MCFNMVLWRNNHVIRCSCAGNWKFEGQGFRDGGTRHKLRIAGVSRICARGSCRMVSPRFITLRPAVAVNFPRRIIRMFYLVMVMVITMSASVVLGLGQDATPSFLANYGSLSDQQHFRVLNNGQQVQLVLDQFSASGFGSINKYLFGNIGMRLKLVPGDSAGTVTAYYMSSQTVLHDEMDFEFLGNVSGQPYILQTNVFANGIGGREERIYLWFDPTADFHTYSVLWNRQQIVFFVDDVPIRVFKNNRGIGIAYPDSQPVGVYSTIFNGEDWATNDGWVKLNWTMAPFVATYEAFGVDACLVQNWNATGCVAATGNWWDHSDYQSLTFHETHQLAWVRKNFLLYNYCNDKSRYASPPPECYA